MGANALDRATERRWWRAALRRDEGCDGDFVFAVSTTAVYCRPGCPARRPRREHVSFFRSPADAEREGYRPCLRCRPRAPKAPPRGVLAACAFIARHLEEPLTLRRIAPRSGWSPFHLQRRFRRALGVTPLEYARRLRFERFRRGVQAGRRVAPALQAAGFGSSSRLYERGSERLGMTPAALARGGAGMSIAYDVLACPLGMALVAATPLGICAVELGRSARTLAAALRARFPYARIARSPGLLRPAKSRLRELLSGGVADPALPLDVRATAFQAAVWDSLRAIPRGETRTYAEIARAIGRPAAARAVARACASNPVAILVPCHRAVGARGELRGYRWGLTRKKALLAGERRGR